MVSDPQCRRRVFDTMGLTPDKNRAAVSDPFRRRCVFDTSGQTPFDAGAATSAMPLSPGAENAGDLDVDFVGDR